MLFWISVCSTKAQQLAAQKNSPNAKCILTTMAKNVCCEICSVVDLAYCSDQNIFVIMSNRSNTSCSLASNDAAKLIRCHLSADQCPQLFKGDFNQDLGTHKALWLELLAIERHPTSKMLSQGFHLAFSSLSTSETNRLGKGCKTHLQQMVSRSRSITTGKKSHDVLLEAAEIIKAKGTGKIANSSSSKQCAAKQPSKESSAEDIAALYGLGNSTGSNSFPKLTCRPCMNESLVDIPCSQSSHVTVQSSDAEDCLTTATVEYEQLPALTFWCAGTGRFMRQTAARNEEAVLEEGPEGFCVAVFADGQKFETEVPNLHLCTVESKTTELPKRLSKKTKAAASARGCAAAAATQQFEEQDALETAVSKRFKRCRTAEQDSEAAGGQAVDNKAGKEPLLDSSSLACLSTAHTQLADGTRVRYQPAKQQAYIPQKLALTAGASAWQSLTKLPVASTRTIADLHKENQIRLYMSSHLPGDDFCHLRTHQGNRHFGRQRRAEEYIEGAHVTNMTLT